MLRLQPKRTFLTCRDRTLLTCSYSIVAASTGDQSTLTAALNTLTATVASVVGQGTSAPGQTFTLTTGVDNIVGTSGNDTINAYINTTTATAVQTTLTGSDVINGGAGTDTLNLSIEGANAAGSLPAATITNVENFFIRDLNTSGASTYNFATVAGEQQVWNDRSTQNVTFNNLGTGTTVGVKGDNSNNVSLNPQVHRPSPPPARYIGIFIPPRPSGCAETALPVRL